MHPCPRLKASYPSWPPLAWGQEGYGDWESILRVVSRPNVCVCVCVLFGVCEGTVRNYTNPIIVIADDLLVSEM